MTGNKTEHGYPVNSEEIMLAILDEDDTQNENSGSMVETGNVDSFSYTQSRPQRRDSGIGLSLQSSMSHAEALLMGRVRRTSGELAMNYGDDSKHLPIYSQAEMDSALEQLRHELQQGALADGQTHQQAPEIEAVGFTGELDNMSDKIQELQAQLDMEKLQSAALYHQIKVYFLIIYSVATLKLPY